MAPLEASLVNQAEKIRNLIPEASFIFCQALIEHYPVRIQITKSRKSKYGDFRMTRNGTPAIITVNGDLNPYAFLITFLHEMAHRITYEKYGGRIQAHGKEWKEEFKNVMRPVWRKSIFPEEVLDILGQHMKNPKASTATDSGLYLALRKYDERKSQITYLSQVSAGSSFQFRNKVYRLIEKKRKRALCERITDGKKYLIPLIAEISMLQIAS